MPRLSAVERREVVAAWATRKSLLVHWCCFCGTAKDRPEPVAAADAGVSDGIHPKCVEAYKAAYGFGSKKAAA